MNVQNLQTYLKTLFAEDFYEDVIRHGDPEAEITGVVTCWMLNTRVIDFAVAEGCNLVISHECPFFELSFKNTPSHVSLDFRADRMRREALDAHGVAVIQCHRTLDAFCIAAAFEAALGLGTPALTEKQAGGYESVRVIQIEPTPLAELIERWKAALGLPCIRVVATDLDRPIRTIGMVWGGIGLCSNLPIPDRLVELDVDLLVGGEMDEYAIQYYAEVGIPMVELGHEVSESIGMNVAADHLTHQFPDLKVRHFTEPPLHRFV